MGIPTKFQKCFMQIAKIFVFMFVLFVMMHAFSCCTVVIGMGIPTKFKKGFMFIMMKVFSCGKIQIGYYTTNKIWDYMKYDNDQSEPL